jgi:hypothetical protein
MVKKKKDSSGIVALALVGAGVAAIALSKKAAADECPAGQHMEGGICVPDVTTCPPGQHLVNGQCVTDTIDADLSSVTLS